MLGKNSAVEGISRSLNNCLPCLEALLLGDPVVVFQITMNWGDDISFFSCESAPTT